MIGNLYVFVLCLYLIFNVLLDGFFFFKNEMAYISQQVESPLISAVTNIIAFMHLKCNYAVRMEKIKYFILK